MKYIKYDDFYLPYYQYYELLEKTGRYSTNKSILQTGNELLSTHEDMQSHNNMRISTHSNISSHITSP